MRSKHWCRLTLSPICTLLAIFSATIIVGINLWLQERSYLERAEVLRTELLLAMTILSGDLERILLESLHYGCFVYRRSVLEVHDVDELAKGYAIPKYNSKGANPFKDG